MTDLDELSRLLQQATPGPWIEMEMHPYLFANPRGPQPWHHDIVGRFDYHSDANRAAIAALRNHAEELVRDARLLREAEELGRYGNDDGARDWVTAGTWLYPGDRIVVVRGESEQREAP
jgi:hypothetical protein